LVFHTCIYRTLIRLLTLFPLLPCFPIIQELTVHYAIQSSYMDALYFNIIYSIIREFFSGKGSSLSFDSQKNLLKNYSI
jgi:hypothetical protein